ncbi:SDR family NAD(P)-dependent oxidoreductase [Microbacterium sp. Mu-80]|uniref:SDR family NAD(P)-dependent oxidoreductase n=1 Tax=Microbacterium bandirmense TaxID=3122050 RepID=A0ABU8L9V3_9MICO
MDLGLTGKRVLISGSTQGIGYAVAAAARREGASVIVNGRTPDRVSAATERLRREIDASGEVTGISADLTDPAQIDSLLDAVGAVDVLINNAGTFGLMDFTETTDADWQGQFDLNLMAGMRLSRRLLPPMLQRGWGRIVFIGTESAVDVPGDMIPYGTMKAASLALAAGLAKLTRGTEVTVNTVLGGPAYSDGVAATVEQIAAAQSMTVEQLKAGLVRDSSLLQRFIHPREIADLVVYLSSPLASATNGAALRADGGVLTTAY